MMSFLQDVRYAVRVLSRTKGWTAVVVLSLALGIGANTALFSAVNGLLLNTLPVENPDTLVRLRAVGRNDMSNNSSDYGNVTQEGGLQTRAIINQAAVAKFFPDGENPLGRRFGSNPENSGDIEVVGVVRDARYNSLRDAPPPTMYVPHTQNPLGAMSFEVRTAGDPAPVIGSIREATRQVDANVPLMNVSTQLEQIERRFGQERVFAQAYAIFGGLALLIASIGLFGLMSHSVTRRTNEIGIRMALGADRGDVVRMIMRESLALVVIGVAIGLGAALAAGRLVATLLFGLAPSDTATVALATLVMVAMSAFAGYFPARRASRVDPIVALHYE